MPPVRFVPCDSGIKCSACSRHLTRQEIDGVVVEYCQGCCKVWLSRYDLGRIVEANIMDQFGGRNRASDHTLSMKGNADKTNEKPDTHRGRPIWRYLRQYLFR